MIVFGHLVILSLTLTAEYPIKHYIRTHNDMAGIIWELDII